MSVLGSSVGEEAKTLTVLEDQISTGLDWSLYIGTNCVSLVVWLNSLVVLI